MANREVCMIGCLCCCTPVSNAPEFCLEGRARGLIHWEPEASIYHQSIPLRVVLVRK